MKKRKLNLKGLIVLLLAIIVIVLVVIISNGGYHEAEVEIPEGAGTKKIARILKENDIISSKILFELAVKTSGKDGQLRYGMFELNSDMSYSEMIESLVTGGKRTDTVVLTIPEGYTIKQIGKKCEEAGLFTADEFYNACKNEKFDYPLLSEVRGSDFALEGFLFPNTYDFYPDATPRDVITAMLDAYSKEFNESDIEKAKALGYSYNEVIRVASIIEREVKEPTERAMVAGVIYNRLKIGMKLEMCSTIQYILGEQHDKLYEVDLQIDSPYNTYMYEGLPVGPIANPGKASIEAALNPVSHDYLYFVLMDEATGKHYFSKTFEEHLNAKNKYIK